MLVGVGGVQLFDGLGDAVVEPRTASPSQPLVQRVIDQRVPEKSNRPTTSVDSRRSDA